MPVFPFWLVNLVPALVGVRLATFAAATAIGIIPATFAFAFVGAGLDSVIAAQQAAYRACLAPGGPIAGSSSTCSAITPQLIAALGGARRSALMPVW